MSDPAHPESPASLAFGELEHLVRNLGEELSVFRKRAHQAESRLKSLGSSPGGDASAEERMTELEQENARLRARIEEAAERTRATLERVRFVRQQQAIGGES